MNETEAIALLEVEWNFVDLTGFFGKLRAGAFDQEAFERVKDILNSIELSDSDVFNRRFVELTWFIPMYLLWQREGWAQDGKDTQDLDEAINFFGQRLTTILGLP